MKVHLPSPLYSYTAQRKTVDAQGANLAQVFADLDAQFPGLRFRVIDEQGEIRAHIKLFVNGESVDSLRTTLTPRDEIHIVAALSGG